MPIADCRMRIAEYRIWNAEWKSEIRNPKSAMGL